MTPRSIDWTGAPIDVVSLGIGDPGTLPSSARKAIDEADVIVGSRRHFAAIEEIGTGARRVEYPSPLSELPDLLDGLQSVKVAVLASGDALLYGIGRTLIDMVGRANLRFHPNISSIQACFHVLGLDWRDAEVVSLHGRPLSSMRRHLEPGSLLAVFTDRDANPRAVAAELSTQRFGDSIVWVCETMGGDDESVTRFEAAGLASEDAAFRDPNVCVVQVEGSGRLPTFPGIPDHWFSTGMEPGHGMISKREVRLAILSFMQPVKGETAWDIGAGCGSVSVEWARWNPAGEIHAIESHPERLKHLDINRDRFGVEANCIPRVGVAPEVCGGLPDPQCIFIGGTGGALDAMIDYAWGRLGAGGKLVSSAVTEASRSILMNRWKTFAAQSMECEWSEIAVTKNLPGAMETRQLKPVALLKCTKPGSP